MQTIVKMSACFRNVVIGLIVGIHILLMAIVVAIVIFFLLHHSSKFGLALWILELFLLVDELCRGEISIEKFRVLALKTALSSSPFVWRNLL